ncbi:MAG: amino acid permease [Alphaproteobacteria bacterium]|nr:MAG: amino acid permease [Alphaproteobacteria bacterium]
MISIGGIVGAGLFVNSANAIAAIGPAVIISYVLTGLIVLFVMRMLGEMAMAYPETGAFTEFSRVAMGNLAGFTSGWLYWYFWVIVVAFEAIAGAKIVALWLPDIPIWVTGLALTVVLTGSNLLSTRSYGEFEFWFSSIKVAAIIAFIVIAASYAFGVNPAGASTFGNWFNDGGFAPNGWMPVLTGVTALIFTLVGAEIATVAAAEARESEKVIANLTTVLIFRILFFYVGAIALIVAVVPWREIATQAQVQLMSPFTMALDKVGIAGAGMVMDVIVLVAVLSCLNSGIYVASRVMFTLAAKKDAPMWLVQVDKRGVPSRAILVGAAIACAAVALEAFFPKEIFGFLINASGALMIFVYMLVVASHLILRPKISKDKLQLATWFYPFSGWIVLAAMSAVLLAMAVTPGRDAELFASTTCLVVIVAAYFIFRRKRAT